MPATLDQAEQLFTGIQQNDFASAGQQAQAVQSLQLIAQKRQLAQSTQPAVESSETPRSAPAAPPRAVPAPASGDRTGSRPRRPGQPARRRP